MVGPQRVRDILPDQAEELLQRRFAIIQVWRPIHDPVETYPLAMADAQTLSPPDMIVSERRAPGRIGQTYAIKYNPAHKWYWFPRMRREEAYVFKVFDSLKDGRARLVTGSPGGRTIPNTTLWVVLNLVEFGLGPREAVDAPRTHHQWFPDVLVLEGRSWADTTRASLESMGHRLGTAPHQGNANTIVVDPDGRLHGIADRRRSTTKASGD